MALTYYIRSWDPRSTYPTNPQEGDICYTITLDQTWAPVGGVKKDNIVKEEVYQNGAWVEQGGGGSDIDHPYALLADGDVDAAAFSYGGVPVIGGFVESILYPPDPNNIPETVDVKFNGTLYENVRLEVVEALGLMYYGAPLNLSTMQFDWSVYPFVVTFDSQEETLLVLTENEGEYPVKVGTPDFDVCVPNGTAYLYTNAMPPSTYFIKRYAVFSVEPYT